MELDLEPTSYCQTNESLNIIQIMLGMSKGLDLDIVGSMPVLLKHPSFAVKESMWVKKDDHPTIDKVHIITKRYEYIKIGKTFGFETTRYICIFQDHLFYFDGQTDKDFKGYCPMDNVYVQWFRLKSGRFLLFLTNTEQSTFFYFESSIFWEENRHLLAKYMVQLNYKQRYDEIESIGKGSFSVVMKVKCVQTGQYYAAKIINKKDKNKAPTKNLVLEERRILRMIKSQYVYKFQQLYEQEHNFVVILEYLPGKDLMNLWKEKKMTDPAIIVPLLKMIMEGIRDIHDAKIIHRDLKPQNILINTTTFRPSIIDFGLSLVLDQKVNIKNYKRCGTMGYMAPQVIENSGEHKKPYNYKCDLFSFGIICHMLLMGYNPVKGDSYDETYMKNKACQIHLDKNQLLSRWGEHSFMFLTKLLSKYPHFRYDAEQALKSEFLTKKVVAHDKEESSSTLEDKKHYHSFAVK